MKTNEDPNKDSTIIKLRVQNTTTNIPNDDDSYENEVRTITSSKKDDKD